MTEDSREFQLSSSLYKEKETELAFNNNAHNDSFGFHSNMGKCTCYKHDRCILDRSRLVHVLQSI